MYDIDRPHTRHEQPTGGTQARGVLHLDRKDLWVIHLDMDAFFASVEQRDNPRLRSKPVVVGGSPYARGVVSTCSYEARKFGVHSAMPSREALRLCPHAIFIQPDLHKYSLVSRQIRTIMQQYSDTIEPVSLDEAYVDVTGQDAITVARVLKEQIRREVHLTASVGVSYCKFLSKIASDMDKPDGLTIVTWARAQELLPLMPVRRIPGVGPATEQALGALGVTTCGDLLRADTNVLQRRIGRRADELIMLAQGIDPRPVVTDSEVKSIGEENTFAHDQDDRAYLVAILDRYAENLSLELKRHSLACRTVTVKIKWNVFIEGGSRGGDFQGLTRSQTVPFPIQEGADIAETARAIFSRIDFAGKKVRLLGLAVHNFVYPGEWFQSRLPI